MIIFLVEEEKEGGIKLDKKKVLLDLVDKKLLAILETKDSEKAKTETEEIFAILELLEDQETVKNWLAQSIAELASDESFELFVRKGVRLLRPQARIEVQTAGERAGIAFEKGKVPTKPAELSYSE